MMLYLKFCVVIYSSIQKYHHEKVEMGPDDLILLYGHVSLDVQAHAICLFFFKVEQVLLMSNCLKQLLMFKVHLSIHAEVCDIWSNPKSYNRYHVHFCVPWILGVDSHDLHAGTTNDCMYGLYQLSVHVSTCSIHMP